MLGVVALLIMAAGWRLGRRQGRPRSAFLTLSPASWGVWALGAPNGLALGLEVGVGPLLADDVQVGIAGHFVQPVASRSKAVTYLFAALLAVVVWSVLASWPARRAVEIALRLSRLGAGTGFYHWKDITTLFEVGTVYLTR